MEVPSIIKGSVLKAYLKKKGDLATAMDDGQLETISVGPDGAVLTADSSNPTGVKWVSGANGSAAWGSIVGNLGNQIDLKGVLQNKADVTHAHTASQVGLGNVTDDAQVKKAAASVDGNLVAWSGTAGDTVVDSGKKLSDLALAAHRHDELYEPADANIQSHLSSTANPHDVSADQVVPSQAGNNGKFLTTNGTTVSWADAAAGTPPSGNGFRHITDGAEDAAAKLVADADVAPGAAIAESKLNLNYATHANTNDPTAGEKEALTGTSGTPGTGNRYVTDADPRNTDSRTPTVHGSSAHTGTIGTPPQVGLGNVSNEAQIPKSLGTAKGSLIGFSDGSTPVEVMVGGDNKVLTADSTQPSGVAWKDAPGGTPAAWGSIAGTLSNQTDLEAALQNKADLTHAHTASQVGLGNVTNDAQVKKAAASVDGSLVAWSGTAGDTVIDSGKKLSDLALAAHGHDGIYEPADVNIQSHLSSTANPHNVSADQVVPSQAGNNGKFLTTNGSTVSWGDAAAGTPPLGNGFRHITDGAEDATAKLVVDTDVAPGAAIAESKLSLNYPTHNTVNDPTAEEKAALTGTSGTPGASNKYVTDDDPRNTDARAPMVHGSAVHIGTIGTSDQIGLGNVPNVDTTDPSNIIENATHRFTTDAEKIYWNSKQDSLGFTAVPNTRQVNGHALSGDVTVSKSDIGLGNCDNTSDINKPISTATQTALNGKENSLPSRTGNANKYLQVKADETGFQYGIPAGGSTPAGTGWRHVTAGMEDAAASTPSKTDVGLGNVTNEAQIAKSIGTAKGDLVGFTASGTPVRIPVGVNGKILMADDMQAAGVAWKDAPATGFSGGIDEGGASAIYDGLAAIDEGNASTIY